jgi:cytochrome c oxidase cbb3-type subunit 2
VSFHTNPRLLAVVPVSIFAGLTTLIALVPAAEMNARYPVPVDAAPVPGSVRKGREIWLRENCSACHTQQVRVDDRLPPEAEGRRRPLDMDRRYGVPSRPQDYAGDYPPTLGSQRTGPDLFNVGDRVPSEDWHYVHLFAPRAVVPASNMQRYPWLFRGREDHETGDRRILLTDEMKARLEPDVTKRRDVQVWATPDAQALVAYLLFLRQGTRAP